MENLRIGPDGTINNSGQDSAGEPAPPACFSPSAKKQSKRKPYNNKAYTIEFDSIMENHRKKGIFHRICSTMLFATTISIVVSFFCGLFFLLRLPNIFLVNLLDDYRGYLFLTVAVAVLMCLMSIINMRSNYHRKKADHYANFYEADKQARAYLNRYRHNLTYDEIENLKERYCEFVFYYAEDDSEDKDNGKLPGTSLSFFKDLIGK